MSASKYQNRRECLKSLSLGMAALTMPQWLSGGSALSDRPNILFILTDDQRPDAMGCYGNSSIRTPNFDAIAAEGARLDNFYVAAPLCCPSRAAFLLGLYPHQSGILTNARKRQILPAGHPTIAAKLNEAGYMTGFVGKAHMGGDPRRWGFKEVPIWLPGGASKHMNPRLMVAGKRKVVKGHITQIFSDAALAWLEKHQSQPWFLWFATTAPHVPYLNGPAHAYDSRQISPPPLWPEGEPLSSHDPFTDYRRQLYDWAAYYSTISMLDEQVGRILTRLKELGLSDNTIMFVAGDNGMMLGSHGFWEKWVWFEESARVPALARWPGRIKPGTKVAAAIVSVDLYPTLCEIAGVAAPKGMEGVNMLPALTGQEPLRKIAYSEVKMEEWEGRHWQMVRAERFKYVKFVDGAGEEHLYDLTKDPHEMKDLAGEAGCAEPLGEMRALRRKWLEATPKWPGAHQTWAIAPGNE